MDIRDRLKELKKDELVILARNLKATGWSGLGKESLIDHIIDNSNEQDITAVLNGGSQDAVEKIPWWKRHKIAGLLVIIVKPRTVLDFLTFFSLFSLQGVVSVFIRRFASLYNLPNDTYFKVSKGGISMISLYFSPEKSFKRIRSSPRNRFPVCDYTSNSSTG